MGIPQTHEVIIDRLVHGGQGIGVLPDGKKALVWNVLPGERVQFITRKKKSSFVEGVATEIIEVSPEREAPCDELYLSTSPWQMMKYEAENKYKLEILAETMQRAGVELPARLEYYHPDDPWHYRGKMEYSFYGDDDGIHLAFYNRGTRQKQVVSGSSIARKEIDATANRVLEVLRCQEVRAGDLKSLIVRCNKAGDCVAALFTRREDLPQINELADICRGISVYFSDPRSPASVPTRRLFGYGEAVLDETLNDRKFVYDVLSFFQVNPEPYEQALALMAEEVAGNNVVDMYAGAGTIGLSITENELTLVESDENSIIMARRNVAINKNVHTTIVHAPSEQALEYISGGADKIMVFDPPRAGLHKRVVEAVIDNRPAKILYLSCNPSTLARDLKMLQNTYRIEKLSGLNFFPKTPHIEALAVLSLKNESILLGGKSTL